MLNEYSTSADTPPHSRGSFDLRPKKKPVPVFVVVFFLTFCFALGGYVWSSVQKNRESDPSVLNLPQIPASLDIKYPRHDVQPYQPVEHRTFMAQCDETDLLCMQVATQDPAATFEMLSAVMPKNAQQRFLLRIAVTPLDAQDSPPSPSPTRLQQTIAY